MGGLRSHRRVVIGVLAAVAAATVCMLALGVSVATTAAVLGPSVAVAGLLVALIDARARSVSDDRLRATARQLARDVRDLEADVLARLMADSDAVTSAEVSFAQPEPPYWRVDGGDRQGTLSEVAGYYRSLNRGRLVVLDEMDRDDVEPQRAASVIRAVNQFTAGDLRPVVITCRTNRYQQLSGHGTAAVKPPSAVPGAGRREVVQDATVPRRPAVFLDWAYQAGLMRLSGIAVQFRHREFQTWLMSRDPST